MDKRVEEPCRRCGLDACRVSATQQAWSDWTQRVGWTDLDAPTIGEPLTERQAEYIRLGNAANDALAECHRRPCVDWYERCEKSLSAARESVDVDELLARLVVACFAAELLPDLVAALRAARVDNERLRRALERYANENNWCRMLLDHHTAHYELLEWAGSGDDAWSGPAIARAALKGSGFQATAATTAVPHDPAECHDCADATIAELRAKLAAANQDAGRLAEVLVTAEAFCFTGREWTIADLDAIRGALAAHRERTK